jgi:3-oxoacyl-[acyl-carrier protein] reductase
MAARRAKVMIADINGKAAAAAVEEIIAAGGTAAACTANVGFAEDIKRMVEETIAAFGALHILFNNAFTTVLGTVEQLAEADWDLTQNVTLKSVYLGSKYALPHIRAAGGGAIVNTSSMHALVPFRGFAAYQAAKGGVCALTRQMSIDFARYNIRVNAVLPGPTETGAMTGIPPAYLEKCAKRMHLLRIGKAEEVAEAVAFLASDAASLITGVSLPVDGGAASIGEPDWLTDSVEILPTG